MIPSPNRLVSNQYGGFRFISVMEHRQLLTFERFGWMRRYAPKPPRRIALATVLSLTPRLRAIDENGIPSRERREASEAMA